MNKKVAIIVSLVLTVVFTLGIVWTANQKYAKASKTVDVAQTTRFIPVGSVISESDIKMVPVPEKTAKNMVTKPEFLTGKSPVVSLVKEQYIYKNSVSTGASKQAGYVAVFIPTDASSSAMVTAGEKVNVHLIDRNNRAAQNAPVIYKGAMVLHSLDQQGNEIVPGSAAKLSDVSSPKGNVPVTVAIEVPEDIAKTIVQYAHNDAIYLSKTDENQSPAVNQNNNSKKTNEKD